MLQGDTLAPCLFIIYLDYLLRTSIDLMKENGFTLAKARSWRYPVQTTTDANYADDIALLADIPTQVKSLLHSLGRAAGGIGLHVNADKTEFIYFNQRSDISTLKLVDKFPYLRSSVSSAENDTRQAKAWIAIDSLSIIWKFFSKHWSYQYYYMDAPFGSWLSVPRKNLMAITRECY